MFQKNMTNKKEIILIKIIYYPRKRPKAHFEEAHFKVPVVKKD